MALVYLTISTVGVLLWTPILIKFFRSWMTRRNPVSLSICAAICLIMWSTMAGAWLVTGKVGVATLITVTSSMSLLVAGYAHAAFYWSKLRFSDDRTSPRKGA